MKDFTYIATNPHNLKDILFPFYKWRNGNAESSDGLSMTTQLINDRGEIWTRSNPPSTHGFLNKSPLQGFYRFVLRSIDFRVNPQPLLILKRFSTPSGFCSFSLFQSTDGFLEAWKSGVFFLNVIVSALLKLKLVSVYSESSGRQWRHAMKFQCPISSVFWGHIYDMWRSNDVTEYCTNKVLKQVKRKVGDVNYPSSWQHNVPHLKSTWHSRWLCNTRNTCTVKIPQYYGLATISKD